MNVSLILPLKKSSELEILRDTYQNLSSFFKPFQIQVELIVSTDIETKRQFDKNPIPQQKISIHWATSERPTSRTVALRKGFELAQGTYLAPLSIDLPTPLGDLLNLVHELVARPDLRFVFGHRFNSRKPITGSRSPWHQTLEGIILEKLYPLTLRDPISPVWVFYKEDWPKISPAFDGAGWYNTHLILERISSHKLPYVEVPIHYRLTSSSQIPLFSEFLRWMAKPKFKKNQWKSLEHI